MLEGSRQTEERFAQAKTVLDEKVELYDSLSQKLASLMQQADQHKNEVFEHSGDRSSAEAEISSLQRMAETLERRKAALLSDKDSGEDSNKETLDNLNQMRHEKERIVDNLEHIKEQRLLKKEEFAAMREDEKKLARTFEDLPDAGLLASFLHEKRPSRKWKAITKGITMPFVISCVQDFRGSTA